MRYCTHPTQDGTPCGKPLTKTGECITGRKGAVWRKQAATVYQQETHCWICKRPVDQTLPPNHKWARSVDHKDGNRHNNQRTNLALAHQHCNKVKGANPTYTPTDKRHSRQW